MVTSGAGVNSMRGPDEGRRPYGDLGPDPGVAADPMITAVLSVASGPAIPVVSAELGDTQRHHVSHSPPSILPKPPSLPSLEFEPFSKIHLISQAH